MIAKWLLKILKNLRRSGAIALLASWASIAGLGGRSIEAYAQAITPPWVVGPAAVSCAGYTFPSSGSAIGLVPSPAEAGKPFGVAYRGFFSVDQFYIESVPGGFRVNVRGTETGLPIARCYLLQSSLLIAPSGNFIVEDALFRDTGIRGIYESRPSITSYPFTVVPPPAPAPSLSAMGILLLAVALMLLTRRHFRAASVILIFQLIAPPLWRFHI
jgi:hypothetical protein